MPARIESATPPFTSTIQEKLDQIMPSGVPPLALFTMLARDERLFMRFMNGGLLDKGRLSLREREIVIDRVTAQCKSEYEWGVHAAFFAKRVKFTDEELFSIVHGNANDPCWTTPAERTLIHICDALHEDCSISDDLWNDAEKQYSPEALLEIIMLAGFYRTVSYLTNAAQLPLENFATRFPEKTEN